MGFLSGYRVLDLTDERGLVAGRMLADLGADVVQVEPPGGAEARDGSLVFDAYAANKRGIVADLDSDEGRDLIRDLAAEADFLIESADPGVMADRGLDWPDLRERNPRLVYVSITAFGRTGPKSGHAASDLTIWAAGGPLDPHRDGDRPPVRISIEQAYRHAGADAAAGALFALHARHRTGRGQHVDVSAQASLGMATLGSVLAHAVGDSRAERAPHGGSRVDRSGSGSGTPASDKKWPCRDGVIEFHLGMGPAAGEFSRSFMRWMVEDGGADPALLDIDWRTLPDRITSGEFPGERLLDIRAQVAAFLATKTKREVLTAAVARKLLCVPIYDTADVVGSEQLAARDFFVRLGTGRRARTLPGPFARVDGDAFDLRRPAPEPGEHTADVVAEWLGRRPADSGSEPRVEAVRR